MPTSTALRLLVSTLGAGVLVTSCRAIDLEDSASSESAQSGSTRTVLPTFSADEAPNEKDWWSRAQGNEAFAKGVRTLCIDGGGGWDVGMVGLAPPQDLDYGPDPNDPSKTIYVGPWQSATSFDAQRMIKVRMWGSANSPDVTPRWWYWKWDGTVAQRIAAHKRLVRDRALIARAGDPARRREMRRQRTWTKPQGSDSQCYCPSAGGVDAKCPLPASSPYDPECCDEGSVCWNEWHPAGAPVTVTPLPGEAPGAVVVPDPGGAPVVTPAPVPQPGIPPTENQSPQEQYHPPGGTAAPAPVVVQHGPAEQAHPNAVAGDLPSKDAVSPNWWMYCLADGDEYILPTGRRWSPSVDHEEQSLLVNLAGVWEACRDRGHILASNGDHDKCTTAGGQAGHRVTYGYLQREVAIPDGWPGVRIALRGPSGAETGMLWAPSQPWPDPSPPLTQEEEHPFDNVSLETSSPDMSWDFGTKTWAMRIGITVVNRNATVPISLDQLEVSGVTDSAAKGLVTRKAWYAPGDGAQASAVRAGTLAVPVVDSPRGAATMNGRYVSFGVDLVPLKPSAELFGSLLAGVQAASGARVASGKSADRAAVAMTGTMSPIVPPAPLDGSPKFDIAVVGGFGGPSTTVQPGSTARWTVEYGLACVREPASSPNARPLGTIASRAHLKMTAYKGSAVLATSEDDDPLFFEIAGQNIPLSCLDHAVFLPIVQR